MGVRFTVRAAVLAVALGAGMLAMACAGGSTRDSGAATAKATSANRSGASGSGSAAVNVELSEWAVKASGQGKAGTVEFTAKNTGSTPHELVVLKTDVDATALQKNASGLVDDTKYTVVGRTAQVAAGSSEKVAVTLAAGKYVLICNVAGHYDLGMRTAFAVG